MTQEEPSPKCISAPGPLAAIGRGILDLLFPPRCPGCGRFGEFLCAQCRAKIKFLVAPSCLRCGRPMPAPGLCAECGSTRSALDGLCSVCLYAPPIREAIIAFKYHGCYGLAPTLGSLMAAGWRERGLRADCLVPVPLHRSRELERGYNQSQRLAEYLGKTFGIAVRSRAIARTRVTASQAELSATERHANVAGAFEAREELAGLRVMLIDDVCTTGATLEACSDATRSAGAAEVQAFTLARAPWVPTPEHHPRLDTNAASPFGHML